MDFTMFFSAMLAALAIENTVFSRALGLNRPVLYLNRAKTGMIYGGVFMWMAVFSSMLASVVNWSLLDFAYARYVRALGFLLCVGIVYFATILLFRLALPGFFRKVVRGVLPLTTFNTALFGALYVSIQQEFWQSVGYAIGVSVGYTAAILIIYFAQKRLAISPVPRSFRGVPILLIYIGLLSLALFGLIGQPLPT
jgi:electron transport complex protein RnfA